METSLTLFDAMKELHRRPEASFIADEDDIPYRLAAKDGCFVVTKNGQDVPFAVALQEVCWKEDRSVDEILQMFQVRHASKGEAEVVEKVLARDASEVEEALLKKSHQFRSDSSVIRSIEVVDPKDINVSDMSMGEFLRFARMGRVKN